MSRRALGDRTPEAYNVRGPRYLVGVLLSEVRATLRRRSLVGPGERILLACSGGVDSVAMTHAMARLAGELELDLAVASVDHGLRPDAAEDVRLAGGLADSLGLPFHPLRVEVPPGRSVQAEARTVRYRALLDTKALIGARAIAVAHTRDDQAETVLAGLLRGASLEGLAGIDPSRGDGVIRPLIDCRRAAVLAYVAHHGLVHREDPSNRDEHYLRVRLRHRILPELTSEDPALVEHLARLADEARDLTALLRVRGAHLLVEAAAGDGGLSVNVLLQADAPSRRAALKQWLGGMLGRAPRQVHLLALESALDGRGSGHAETSQPEVALGAGLAAAVSDGKLVVRRRAAGGRRGCVRDGIHQNH